MPKCPKCSEEIDFLNVFVQTCSSYTFAPDELGEYELIDHIDKEESFCCPECGAKLFCSEDEARYFLTGEK